MPNSVARKTGRRHPLMGALLIAIGLLVTGGAYAAASTTIAMAETPSVSQASLIDEGEKLFLANCASCHGLNVEGTAGRLSGRNRSDADGWLWPAG
jgi:ubiquinol-cytochrome c reductase cytochrome c subunit